MDYEKQLVVDLPEQEFVELVDEFEARTAELRLNRSPLLRRIFAAKLERLQTISTETLHADVHNERNADCSQLIAAETELDSLRQPLLHAEEESLRAAAAQQKERDSIEQHQQEVLLRAEVDKQTLCTRMAQLETELSAAGLLNSELKTQNEELIRKLSESTAAMSQLEKRFDAQEQVLQRRERELQAEQVQGKAVLQALRSTGVRKLPPTFDICSGLTRVLLLCGPQFFSFLDLESLQELQLVEPIIYAVLSSSPVFHRARLESCTRALCKQLSSANELSSRFRQLASRYSPDARRFAAYKLLSTAEPSAALENFEDKLGTALESLAGLTGVETNSNPSPTFFGRLRSSLGRVRADGAPETFLSFHRGLGPTAPLPDLFPLLSRLKVLPGPTPLEEYLWAGIDQAKMCEFLVELQGEVESQRPSAPTLTATLFALLEASLAVYVDYKDAVVLRTSLAAELETALADQLVLAGESEALRQLRETHADHQLSYERVIHEQEVSLLRCKAKLRAAKHRAAMAEARLEEADQRCVAAETVAEQSKERLSVTEAQLSSAHEKLSNAESRLAAVSQLVKSALN